MYLCHEEHNSFLKKLLGIIFDKNRYINTVLVKNLI